MDDEPPGLRPDSLGPASPGLLARLLRAARGLAAERLGRRAEKAAARALARAGYAVLGRRVRTPEGEVDVVALDGETLVLVEVKATASASDPARALLDLRTRRLGRRQRTRLCGAARRLARARGLSGRAVRFDVVAVRLEGGRPRCSILRGAFGGSGR